MTLLGRVFTVIIVSCGLVYYTASEDVKNLKELFDQYNTDSDDGINIIELDIMLRYLQQTASTEQLKKLFIDVDLDNSGKINFSEFCALMGIHSEAPAEKVESNLPADHNSIVEKSFNTFDDDNNGVISLDELNQLMQFLGQRHTEIELLQIMSSVDNDNSRTISLLEFHDLLTKAADSHSEEQSTLHQQFNEIDKDDNGLINANEFYFELTRGGETISPLQAKEMFEFADVNKNGWVDFEEFVKITN